jgi:hypothetical protein
MLAAWSIMVCSEVRMTRAEAARTILIVGAVAALSHTASVHAALYKCTGADGKVAYQDAPCPTSASEQALTAKAPAPPAATPKKTPAGGKTASASKSETVAGAKAKDPAATSYPTPDAKKSAAPPSK